MKTFITITLLMALRMTASAEPSAEQLYNEGHQAFDRGDYPTAIARWRSSYELSKLPLLVLNIAQAYELSGDCPHALSAYRQYVTLDPTSEQRRFADGHIADLEPKCGRPLSREDRVQQPVEIEQPGSRSNVKLASLVTGGGGVALVATGLFFGIRASALGDQVTNDCKMSCNWATEKSKQSDGQRDAVVGKILDGVGVTAIAIGVGLYIYGVRAGQPAVAIQPNTQGATLSWSRRW